MKKYENPKLEIIEIFESDIITSSPGVETPSVDENDGIWDLSINP